jgi:alkylhydroperoxidase/carboxymuconolactone decarboxylase family protein YurZ
MSSRGGSRNQELPKYMQPHNVEMNAWWEKYNARKAAQPKGRALMTDKQFETFTFMRRAMLGAGVTQSTIGEILTKLHNSYGSN